MPSDFDDFESRQSDTPPYVIHEYQTSNRIINVYVSEAIGRPHLYVELFEKLRNCHSSDVVNLYFNTPGGELATGAQFMHAIQDCPGTTVGILDGPVCSVGALLFLSCRDYIVQPYGQLMFHNFSGAVIGKGHEQALHLAAINSWYHRMLREICTPFISEEEISAIIGGHDLWFQSDEVLDRLQIFVEYQADVEAAIVQAEEEETEQLLLDRIAKRAQDKSEELQEMMEIQEQETVDLKLDTKNKNKKPKKIPL